MITPILPLMYAIINLMIHLEKYTLKHTRNQSNASYFNNIYAGTIDLLKMSSICPNYQN